MKLPPPLPDTDPPTGDSPALAFLGKVQDELRRLDLVAIDRAVELLAEAWRRQRRVFVMGNGGSAATASHLVCDLLGATRSVRPLAALSLTADVPLLTALANDHGYESVFAEQLAAQAAPGDVVIVVTASGDSPNVVRAIEAAQEAGASTIGLLGFGGGRARRRVDQAIVLESGEYGVVESVHATLVHLLAQSLSRRIRE